MLNQISPAPKARAESTAIELLVGCHQRIRHFTSVASKLAHAQAATHDEIRSTAESVYRYYSVSLPLHEADEEDSLRPRLDKITDERLHHALAAMHDQHMAIDDLLERLLPLLRMVGNNPAVLADAGGEICSITKALTEMFAAHLQMEEDVIFPAIEQSLTEDDRAELLGEMRNRRKQGAD
ncbi:MAG: hemerythrin domain-containing protein [Candidatus Korobacteraceae bacterium]